MIYTNFKSYIPEDPELLELFRTQGILFLKCDQGFDWYDLRANAFDEAKFKVVFDTKGQIIFWDKDATLLCPEGLSIAQVDFEITSFEEIRDKVLDTETLTLKDKEYTRDQLIAKANAQIKNYQETVVGLITPLQYAKELDMATDDELAYLKNLQIYVVKLNRVPLQEEFPYKIDWPILPTE